MDDVEEGRGWLLYASGWAVITVAGGFSTFLVMAGIALLMWAS